MYIMVDCRLKKNKSKKNCKNSEKKNNSKKDKKKLNNRKKSNNKKKINNKKKDKYETSKNCEYTHVKIKKSSYLDKKKMAIFENKNTSNKKIIHFGQAGASDFTIHKDKDRRLRYLIRHKKRENWDKCDTAGALSRWILWNEPSISSSVTSFKKKFNLK